MYYVYFIRSLKDKTLYIGYTEDLRKRLSEHNTKRNKSTRHKTPFELIYYEAYKSKTDAKFREDNLKRFAQATTALKQRLKNSLAT